MKAFAKRGARSAASGSEPASHRVTRRSSVVRLVGRAALWGCIALVFARGLGAILSDRETPAPPMSAHSRPAGFPDVDAQAFAVAFARVYLTITPGREVERARAVGAFLAQGLSDQAAVVVSPRGPGVSVAQATVAREVSLGGSRALLTVAAFLSDRRTVYLTVPVARDGAGGLVVDDLPSLSAPPLRGSTPAQAPAPLSGPDADAIRDVTDRFLRAYVSGADAGALAYFLAARAGRRVGRRGCTRVERWARSGRRRRCAGARRGEPREVLAALQAGADRAGSLVRAGRRGRAGRMNHLKVLRWLLIVALVLTIAVAVLLIVVNDALAAAGNDVGRNLGGLLRGYAGQIYGGVVAIVGLVFLLNRRYTELAVFLLAAVVVAWLVFSPDQIADAARAIGRQVFG
jgi:hypothetical protein